MSKDCVTYEVGCAFNRTGHCKGCQYVGLTNAEITASLKKAEREADAYWREIVKAGVVG